MSAVADAVLVLHFAFVAFVVGGFVLIVAGGALHWRWVRSRAFRIAHAGAIGFVVLESLVGLSCPLTVLERALRTSGPDASFVAYWVGRLLYYDFPEWVFTALYIAFGCAVFAAWKLIPPRPRGGIIAA